PAPRSVRQLRRRRGTGRGHWPDGRVRGRRGGGWTHGPAACRTPWGQPSGSSRGSAWTWRLTSWLTRITFYHTLEADAMLETLERTARCHPGCCNVHVLHGHRPVHTARGLCRSRSERPQNAAGAHAVLQAGELLHGARDPGAGGTHRSHRRLR